LKKKKKKKKKRPNPGFQVRSGVMLLISNHCVERIKYHYEPSEFLIVNIEASFLYQMGLIHCKNFDDYAAMARKKSASFSNLVGLYLCHLCQAPISKENLSSN